MWRALAWSHHFTKREVWVHKRSLTRHIVLKCLWRDRKVRGHVCVCYVYRFCFFLRFCNWNWELFRQCDIFDFSFYRRNTNFIS
jgi:hypothetical protein